MAKDPEKLTSEDLNAVRSFLYLVRAVGKLEQTVQGVVTADEQKVQIEVQRNQLAKVVAKIKEEIEQLQEGRREVALALSSEKTRARQEVDGEIEVHRKECLENLEKELSGLRGEFDRSLKADQTKLSRLEELIKARFAETNSLGDSIASLKETKATLEKEVARLDGIRGRYQNDLEASLRALKD